MLRKIKKFLRGGGGRNREIDPDEIFLDSSNLPQFNTSQFEGRLEKPISTKSLLFVGILFLLSGFLFTWKVFALQIKNGATFAAKSENNHLRSSLIFANRGAILDRNGEEIATNAPASTTDEFLVRKYSDLPGLSQVVGYVKYPQKDSSGVYYSTSFEGHDGIEKYYNDELSGVNGRKIIETDAVGHTLSENLLVPPENGKNVSLTIDAKLQSKMYEFLKSTAEQVGYHGGAGVIMDTTTGEILSLASFPEYDSQTLSDGSDSAVIGGYQNDPNTPYLNRVIDGLYTPGSIMKPYFALAALTEHVIDPAKQILSTGSISVQNPYDKTQVSIFKDWKALGWVDMRKALAWSSDVYFYEVGGGFEDQKGLGITNLEKYAREFGFGSQTGTDFFQGPSGTIPSPDWKAKTFDGDAWRLGDTYHTAIGQYGWQVTPLQVVRAVAAVANGGKVLQPKIVGDGKSGQGSGDVVNDVAADPSSFQIVREGMRQAVQTGSATGLNVPYVQVAAKTGTAELGTLKQFVNSWITGFFPYDNPRYAFAVLMEKGPRTANVGGLYVMRQLFDWMSVNAPEYLK